MNKERIRNLNLNFWEYILKREKLQEQSGGDHHVTPLIFGLKENINFSFREICVALVPLFYVLVVLFCYFTIDHIII